MEYSDIAKKNYLMKEDFLSPLATKSSSAVRLKEQVEDFRTPFFRDTDRIIHSLSYTRYDDKTQVYSFKNNDHISKRIIHVQLVSKIARTIERAGGKSLPQMRYAKNKRRSFSCETTYFPSQLFKGCWCDRCRCIHGHRCACRIGLLVW